MVEDEGTQAFSYIVCYNRLGVYTRKETKGRWGHIAACLGFGGQYRRLLISGGYSGSMSYDDMWILDLQSSRMEEVRTNKINLVMLN